MSPIPNGQGLVRSVNVGRVRELLLRGRPYPTGIFKEPVEGRVRLENHGVQGDIQADPTVHGGRYKAVYTYATEDYAWWEQRLGVSLPPATFGENLTLEGVSTTDALIGERWRIGSALLQVTQPREPCWKLGAKMGDREFPHKFREVGRAGAYLSIVEEGDVGSGDAVEVVSRPSHPVSVGMLAYLNRVDRKLAQLIRQLASKKVTEQEWAEILEGLQLPASYPAVSDS
jgi:MOSC domain-containing protein YiiM